MIKYIVTLSESDGETIVGRYDSLEEAQQHLKKREILSRIPPNR